MKILHVCPLYYPSIGGNQFHMQTLSEALAVSGHDVHVFTSRSLFHNQFSSELSDHEVINGVKVRRFKPNAWLKWFIPDHLFKIRGGYRLFRMLFGPFESYWSQGPIVPGMLAAIGKLKPDMLMASNNVFFTTYLCYLAKKYFKIPFILMPLTHISDPMLKNPHRLQMLKMADKIIACTEFEKNFLIKMGVEPHKIVAIPLGIPILSKQPRDISFRKEYQIPIDAPLVAYVGRKVKDKGIEFLIDAMRIVWQSVPESYLLLAGQPWKGFEPVIQKHIEQCTLQQRSRIIQVNNFDETDKFRLYFTIDVLAMASVSDAFGVSYLEAWSQNKPVIACRNTPQEDIITDGEDGLLVDYANSTDLAAAILKLIKDEALRTRLGVNGRKNLEGKFQLDRYARRMLHVYELMD